MAVFEDQISAMISSDAKRSIKDVLIEDRKVILSTSEADVIRLALHLGVEAMAGLAPKDRCQTYALMRRGLAGGAPSE